MTGLALRLLPGGLLLLAATVLVLVPPLRDPVAMFVPAFAYAVFGAGLLLGWRFNSDRVVLAVLSLALADQGLRHATAGAPAATGAGPAIVAAVALLLPLDLAALAWMRDRAMLSRYGWHGFGALVVQASVVALLARPEAAPLARVLQHVFVDPRLLRWTAIPQLALVAFALALGFAALRFGLRPGVMEGGTLAAVVAAFIALSAGGGLVATVFLATGGLVLLVSLVETSHAMAYGDELTGLPARRALDDALRALGGRYAVAMVDIDHFKRFNDEYGHDVGDQLLRMIGATLGSLDEGRAFRYGGEEFAVIFPRLSVTEALPHLEALRKRIEATGFTLRGADRPRRKPEDRTAPRRGGRKVAVTVSIGVADAGRPSATPEDVVRAADEALYRAKAAGRNRLST